MSSDPAAIAVRDARLGSLWFSAADATIGPAVARDGIWEPAEGLWLDATVRPGMTVVNVGANVGYFTVWAAELVGAEGHVFAIEPHPDNVALLRRNVADRGLRNVTVIAAAASAQPGSLPLFVNNENAGDHRVFDPRAAVAADAELAAATGGFTDAVEQLSVPAITLDDQFADRRVDVLFIDTQGHDSEVLAGAQRILAQDRPQVLTEFTPSWLRAQGSDPTAVLAEYRRYGFRVGVWDIGAAPGTWDDERIVAWASAQGRWFANLELQPTHLDLPLRARPGSGFWVVERAGRSARHWMTDPTAIISVTGPPATTISVAAQLEPSPGDHRVVTVDGRRFDVTTALPIQVTTRTDAGGCAEIPLSVAGPPRHAPGDPRGLYLAVTDPTASLTPPGQPPAATRARWWRRG